MSEGELELELKPKETTRTHCESQTGPKLVRSLFVDYHIVVMFSFEKMGSVDTMSALCSAAVLATRASKYSGIKRVSIF